MAVQQTKGLEDAYRTGLQALRSRDRVRLSVESPRRLKGSVDIDEALRASFPTQNRWDYAIGMGLRGGRESVYWIEFHTATDEEIAVVRKKFEWLKRWLLDSGTPLRQLEGTFVWVSSGKTTITAASPQIRKLAKEGLVFQGFLKIPTSG